MERVAHGDEPKLTERGRQIVRAAESPFDVGDAAFACESLALGAHAVIGIYRDDFAKQMCERERDWTRAASEVEQAAGSVEAEVLAENRDERGRILRAESRVVPGRALIE
jgi:hypothetical protein